MPNSLAYRHNGKTLAPSKYLYQSESLYHRWKSSTGPHSSSRPTVEARNALAANAQRLAEDGRVQLRKIQGTSTKKGKFAKHSVELEEVGSQRFFSASLSDDWLGNIVPKTYRSQYCRNRQSSGTDEENHRLTVADPRAFISVRCNVMRYLATNINLCHLSRSIFKW